MAPNRKKNYEEDLADRIDALENLIKKKIKKLEDKTEQDKEDWRNELEEKYKIQNEKLKNELNKTKEEHKKEINNLKESWEEIYRKKIQECEEKYQTKISEMEERYINTFRNLSDIRQQNTETQHIEIPRNQITEITKPMFYGNKRDQHPKDFLLRLEEYFAVKQIRKEEMVIVAGDCLRTTAYNWFTTIRFQINNYNDFKSAFIDEYWSRDIQMQTWNQCLSTRQIQADTNYREHFSSWATKLRHLEVPKLSEEEVVRNIASHYPGYLRAILISLPDCTILNAMKILGAEEHRRETNYSDSRQNQYRENNYNQPRTQQRDNNWNNRPPPRRDNYHNQQTPRNNDYNNRTGREQPRNQEHNWREQQQINQVNIEENVNNNSEEREREATIHAIQNIPTSNLSVSPYIQCNIEGESVPILIDTGATVSVLTKEIVDKILKWNPKTPVLPVNSVQISNAVGKKICKVSKQIFCACQIGTANIFVNFIQIENLNEQGIIGADVLNQYNAQINFNNKTIQWDIEQKKHITKFAEKDPKVVTTEEQIKSIEIMEEQLNHVPLEEEEKECFTNLLKKYEHIFSNDPGKIHQYECQIRVFPGDPVCQRPYPVPISKLKKMDQEIQRMLNLGIIEQSSSPWSSPIVGVEKKNGDIRLCIDARQINKKIIPDKECPMNIEDILLKFQGAKYLSSIDLTAGYWQCPLKKECREITAFLYRGRNYHFKVLPFGLINSVAEFQKILDKVLGPEILQFTAVYVDDIHITSTSFEEHLKHLEKIFKRFEQFNVTINLDKSQFLRDKIIFLGHVISAQGISMDPDKIQTIKNFQEPKNKKQVQAFIGFINFYRKFIRDLSQQTRILSQLTRKDVTWEWGEEHKNAFYTIKDKFLEDIIIQYPDFDQEFYLATDASRTHIGAELYQLDEKGNHRTLGFASRTLKDEEQRYYTTELELLAIVFGCLKYRNYILGHVTHLLTDHKALLFLNSCRLLNARLMRWSLKIQEFNLQIKHIPGKENVGADTLTRYPQSPSDNQLENYTRIYINKIMLDTYSKTLTQQFQQLKELQEQDQHIKQIMGRIMKKPDHRYQMYDGLLFYIDKAGKYRVMVPAIMTPGLVKETHEQYGHLGATKIYHLLRFQYQLNHMYRIIKKITQSCDICQKSKMNNQLARGPLISNIPKGPRELVSLDLIGPLPRGQLGARYILVLLDVFTKYIQIYPIKKATTDIILNRIKSQYIPTCGKFKRILTDNGTQFHSKKWIEQLKLLDIQISVTTAYHPEGNPVERANREIGRILRTYCHRKHTSWVEYLKKIEYWLNNTTHTTTGYTPQALMGLPRNPLSLERLIKFPENTKTEAATVMIQLAHRRMKRMMEQRNKNLDKGKKFHTYSTHQQVLIKEHRLSSADDHEIKKLFLLYRGPYTVQEVRPNNTLVVMEDNGQLTTHNMKNVKPYVPPEPGGCVGKFVPQM